MRAPTALELGKWGWGIATAALGIAVVVVVALGRPQGIYDRIKDSATAIGAVVAASALAWSLFFQVSDSQSERNKIIEAIRTDIEEIKEALKLRRQ